MMFLFLAAELEFAAGDRSGWTRHLRYDGSSARVGLFGVPQVLRLQGHQGLRTAASAGKLNFYMQACM
jgi:hypothetical protein